MLYNLHSPPEVLLLTRDGLRISPFPSRLDGNKVPHTAERHFNVDAFAFGFLTTTGGLRNEDGKILQKLAEHALLCGRKTCGKEGRNQISSNIYILCSKEIRILVCD